MITVTLSLSLQFTSEEIESTWVNKKIWCLPCEFQLHIKKIIRELERIIIKINKHNMSILFNETCLNEGMLHKYTFFIYITHTHTQRKVKDLLDVSK